jgi:hypothetical protein
MPVIRRIGKNILRKKCGEYGWFSPQTAKLAVAAQALNQGNALERKFPLCSSTTGAGKDKALRWADLSGRKVG